MFVSVTVDADSAEGLVERLTREVDAAAICFEPDRLQVCIELTREPDRNLGRVLNTVEDWLGDSDRVPTNIEIDGHAYLLGARVPGGVG
jgi:hypothetical protein